jgi:hypothetical protein
MMANKRISDCKHQHSFRLIYRGEIFDYTPPIKKIDRTDRSNWQVVILICKGHLYERKLPPPQPYQKPRALNWRWQ